MIGLTKRQAALKRSFDLLVCVPLLILTFPVIFVLVIVCTLDTKSFGLFHQQRIGLHGKPFRIFKLKTMRDGRAEDCSIAAVDNFRITAVGKILRKWKLDELPQLFNIVIGQMSVVGPRPDVAGYADKLTKNRELYSSVRPGITGPASIKYAREEELLRNSSEPLKFNNEVLWPDKVKINIEYIRNWSLATDIKYIFQTVLTKW